MRQTTMFKKNEFAIFFFTLLILSGLISTAEVFIRILLDTAQVNADEHIISTRDIWLYLFF
ncbi:MAG TPA: hypothetical protein PLU33_09010, partial [Treponemataceae bacterium]|nr:hypothetical protein [Treponemataceae bacterium]